MNINTKQPLYDDSADVQKSSPLSSNLTSQFNSTDVKNAFSLLSREYDKPGMIKLDRLKEILAEMGITDLEIVQLTTQLH